MHYFDRNHGLFENKDAFQEEYHPDEIEERDEEIEAYKNALQPVINGWTPNNVFLYGNTGVGKTVVTEYLLSRLQEDATRYPDLDLDVVSLNCQTLTTSYQVAVALVNELRPSRNGISSTGYPLRTVFDKLYTELDALGGTVLLVLDEIDAIGTDDEILYELPRARSKGDLDDAKIGIIGISNDLTFREKLDARVQDSLCERTIHFSPYDATELRTILDARAEIALRDDALEDGVIEFCSALAARDRGNARQALDLLRLAAEQAEHEDSDRVTEAHVDAARQQLEVERIEEGIRELTTHGHYALLAVMMLAVDEETPARSKAVYDCYAKLCHEAATEPLARRSVNDHLSDLRMLGVLAVRENRTGSRGNYYSYDLDVPVQSARTALEDVLTTDATLRRVKSVDRNSRQFET